MCGPPSPFYAPPPPPPPPPPFPRNARRQMESQKTYTMHIIKDADTANPTVHSFPVDAEALPEVTLDNLRALSSDQLTFISKHLSKLNEELKAATESKEKAREEPTPSCTTAWQPQEEARESDFETPWVLEGIDIPMEVKTVYVRAAEDVSVRRRRYERPVGETFGVSSKEPAKGPYKELVVVYSRQICARGAWAGNYYRPRSRNNLRDTIWRVESTPPPPPLPFGVPPPPPPVRVDGRRRERDYVSDSEDEIIVD